MHYNSLTLLSQRPTWTDVPLAVLCLLYWVTFPYPSGSIWISLNFPHNNVPRICMFIFSFSALTEKGPLNVCQKSVIYLASSATKAQKGPLNGGVCICVCDLYVYFLLTSNKPFATDRGSDSGLCLTLCKLLAYACQFQACAWLLCKLLAYACQVQACAWLLCKLLACACQFQACAWLLCKLLTSACQLLGDPSGPRAIMCPWFDFWFWHYIHCVSKKNKTLNSCP